MDSSLVIKVGDHQLYEDKEDAGDHPDVEAGDVGNTRDRSDGKWLDHQQLLNKTWVGRCYCKRKHLFSTSKERSIPSLSCTDSVEVFKIYALHSTTSLYSNTAKKTNGNLRSLENMEVSVRRMVMAMASLSAMHLGGKKRASQEMAR